LRRLARRRLERRPEPMVVRRPRLEGGEGARGLARGVVSRHAIVLVVPSLLRLGRARSRRLLLPGRHPGRRRWRSRGTAQGRGHRGVSNGLAAGSAVQARGRGRGRGRGPIRIGSQHRRDRHAAPRAMGRGEGLEVLGKGRGREGGLGPMVGAIVGGLAVWRRGRRQHLAGGGIGLGACLGRIRLALLRGGPVSMAHPDTETPRRLGGRGRLTSIRARWDCAP
jgi:hypothetical protein